MGDAMDSGMVLVMSLWDDYDVNMLWLDSTYPTDKITWGGPRGTCDIHSGSPEDVETNDAWANVTFSGIRIGDIGSTYGHDAHKAYTYHHTGDSHYQPYEHREPVHHADPHPHADHPYHQADPYHHSDPYYGERHHADYYMQ